MTLRLELVKWSEEAEAALLEAARGDMPLIRDEVLNDQARLLRASGESQGFVVLRDEGDEWVIVAGAGKNCRPVIQLILEKAKAKGVTVRTHIQREGLKRIYESLGFHFSEYVMRA